MAVGKFLDAETKEIAGLTKNLGDLEGLLNQSQGDLALLLGSSLPPPAGTVADIASLGVSVSRGDWGGAFLDVIGLVPLVGDGVKGLVKGTKIGNKIDNIRKAIAHGKKNLADKVAKAKKNAEKRCKKLTGNKKKKNKDKDAATDCGTNCGAGKNKSSVKKKRKSSKPRQPQTYEKKRRNKDGSTTYTLKTKKGNNVDVTYSKDGYPDFSPYKYKGKGGKAEVEIEMTGDNYPDFKSANQKAGFGNSGTSHPEGYTWHHHEDGKTMVLVKTDAHGAAPHTGGASSARATGNVK